MPTTLPAAPRKIPPGKAFGTILSSMDVAQEDHPAVEVLLVAAKSNTRALFTQTFQNSNWRLDTARAPLDAIARLRDNPMAIVIFEDATPDNPVPPAGQPGSWLNFIEQTRKLAHPPKVIVASRQADDRMWAEVLHQGGYDVLPLPLEAAEVVRTVSMAWLEWRHELESCKPATALAAAAGSESPYRATR